MDKQNDKDINVRSKMIEEMTEIALKNTLSYTCAKQIAMNFYNAGYRKIPEGSVVLTREEYERLLKEETLCERLGNDIDVKLKYIYELEDKVAQVRKETAEKFAERVKMAFYYHFDEIIPSIMADEIDKICKEIVEGK